MAASYFFAIFWPTLACLTFIAWPLRSEDEHESLLLDGLAVCIKVINQTPQSVPSFYTLVLQIKNLSCMAASFNHGFIERDISVHLKFPQAQLSVAAFNRGGNGFPNALHASEYRITHVWSSKLLLIPWLWRW